MSHKMPRPCIVKVYVLGYFPLLYAQDNRPRRVVSNMMLQQ